MGANHILAALAVAAIISSTARASGPDAWIDSRSDVLFDADGAVTALRETWIFDPNYSKIALESLEKNVASTTVIDLAPLARTIVAYLAGHGFFITVQVDGGKVALRKAFDYFVEELADKRIALHFTLPLTEPHRPKKDLVLQIADPTHSAAFDFARGSPSLTLVNAPPGCTATAIPVDHKADPDGFTAKNLIKEEGYAVVACPIRSEPNSTKE